MSPPSSPPAIVVIPAVIDEDAPLEVDDEAVFFDCETSTASISSSIMNYRTIFGRTYHSERDGVEYWGATDDKANDSMDILGHVFTRIQGDTLYLAPLEKGKVKTALDIGCGTGTWAIDFADEFENTEVTGTDISPIQPAWVPPNLKFEIDDCTKPWTFKPNTFDYIHERYMIGSIIDWDSFFSEAYFALKPGGYVESFETDGGWLTDDDTHGEATEQWGRLFQEGMRKLGKPVDIIPSELQRKAMAKAGFVDIEERNFKCPVGGWPKDKRLKEIGIISQAAVVNDFEGFILFAANVLGWRHEEVQVYGAKLRNELKSGKHHLYFRVKVVWGRKPSESEA